MQDTLAGPSDTKAPETRGSDTCLPPLVRLQ